MIISYICLLFYLLLILWLELTISSLLMRWVVWIRIRIKVMRILMRIRNTVHKYWKWTSVLEEDLICEGKYRIRRAWQLNRNAFCSCKTDGFSWIRSRENLVLLLEKSPDSQHSLTWIITVTDILWLELTISSLLMRWVVFMTRSISLFVFRLHSFRFSNGS